MRVPKFRRSIPVRFLRKERPTMRKNILKFVLGFVLGVVVVYVGCEVLG